MEAGLGVVAGASSSDDNEDRPSWSDSAGMMRRYEIFAYIGYEERERQTSGRERTNSVTHTER